MSLLTRLWTCFQLIIFAWGLLAYASPAYAESWLKNYSHNVQRDAQKYNIPGYAMVFYQQGETPQVFVYGVTHKGGQKITPDTVFRLASVSKTFTSLLLGKLDARGSLGWDTPITELVPDIDFSKHKMQGLTLAHIAGQSSGYMPNAYDNLIEANYSLQRVLTSLADLEPLCEPGACYTYQNALFGAIEHYFVSQNTSYHRELSEQLLTPLGMANTSVGKTALMSNNNWARPHTALARDKWHQTTVRDDYYRFSPAAGVNASIRDMTIYLQALLGEFPTVLPKEIIDDVTTPRVETRNETYRRAWRKHLNSAHYGLGWRVYDFEGHKVNFHSGWVKGYRADVSFAPEQKAGFVILMNAESNMINSATADFWQRYFDQLGDPKS